MGRAKKSCFVFVLCVFVYILSKVSADQVITAHAGAFGASPRELKYKIEFHPEDAPFHPDDDQESVLMPDENGKNFLCFLPKVEKPKSGKSAAQQNTTSMIMESEKRLRVKTPDELLEILKEAVALSDKRVGGHMNSVIIRNCVSFTLKMTRWFRNLS